MAGAGRGATRGVDRINAQELTYEELVPSSDWTEDSICHCLLIDLPGFKKEHVKLQVDNNGNVIASGERKVAENRHIRFHQSHKVPKNSNTAETSAKFEDEILYVIIPKHVTPMKNTENQIETVKPDDQQQNADNEENAQEQVENIDKSEEENVSYDDDKFHDAGPGPGTDQWNAGRVLLKSTKEKMKKNKGIIVTAVLAFSLGVIMSHQFRSQGE